MEEKPNLDPTGMAILVAVMLVLAVNQVVIKLVNDGLQPVFAAGLRSALGAIMLLIWMGWRRVRLDFARGTMLAGALVGVIFTAEFICLFIALDLTTVTRVSVIFYSMPVWMALAAHFLLPGERLTRGKTLGLALAFAGVAWAIIDRPGGGGTASLWGDLFALGGALGWMGVTLAARVTPMVRLSAEMQMLWQLIVSAPIMLALAPVFGPLIRDLQPLHWLGLGYQAVLVAAGAFLVWFWLLKRYKASSVASFGFLPPVFGVALGWAVLGEEIRAPLIGALVLVAVGIALINRPARR